MKFRKRIFYFFIIFLVAVQFIRPRRNTGVPPIPKSFIDTFQPNDTIVKLLANSCFDCHSNNTKYPWYTNIQPVGWLMAKHINDGKAELNFDDLAALSNRRRNSKFKSISEQIEQDEMPLKSYLLIHRKAALNEADKKLLINFFQSKINNN
ncbi:MAG TPA: heme-binding domain-containing protein [Niabella sp.]|nr:heme-binding domain-containing protein [Niabella sp.]